MKAAVILYPMYSEYELSVAMSILSQGGKDVVTVGYSKAPLKGEAGLSCVADETYDTIDVNDIDSLLLPGMMQPLDEAQEAACVAFLKSLRPGVMIGSISASPYLLSKAGLLYGHRYTAGLYEEDIVAFGMDRACYTGEGMTQDGNLLTARGPCFISFGVTFGRMLNLTFDEQWYRG